MLFISCCVVPAFVMIFCYTRFWFRVKKVTRDVQNFQNSKRRNKMDSTRRLAILVAVLCSSFFLCWTPFHVFHIFRATGIKVTSRTCATLRDVLSTMAYLNACLNPILYSVSTFCRLVKALFKTPLLLRLVHRSTLPWSRALCAVGEAAPAQA